MFALIIALLVLVLGVIGLAVLARVSHPLPIFEERDRERWTARQPKAPSFIPLPSPTDAVPPLPPVEPEPAPTDNPQPAVCAFCRTETAVLIVTGPDKASYVSCAGCADDLSDELLDAVAMAN